MHYIVPYKKLLIPGRFDYGGISSKKQVWEKVRLIEFLLFIASLNLVCPNWNNNCIGGLIKRISVVHEKEL